MAGIVFATRGIYAALEQLKMELMSEKYIWRRKNLNTGKWEDTFVQGMLRPIQLWEYVVPKESPTIYGDFKCPMNDNVNEVLARLNLNDADHYEPKYIGKYVKFAGKAMGLKPFEPTKPLKKVIPSFHDKGISIIPIGLKEDEVKEYDFKDAGRYYQEGI